MVMDKSNDRSENEGLKNPVLIYVTVPDAETGTDLARLLLQKRLCACANIIPIITSLYWWQQDITQDSEALLLVKTVASLTDAVIELVNDKHPYDVPAVSVIPISKMNPTYKEWLIGETIIKE